MAIAGQSGVENRTESPDPGQVGESSQPSPAVEFDENLLPSVEPDDDRAVRQPDVNRLHHSVRRTGEIFMIGGVEVDKTQSSVRVAS